MSRLPSHKLKQYLERPEGDLDLHGLNRNEAEREVGDFLDKAASLGWERVKIITGRGLNSPDGQSVLKEHIQAYLRDHSYRFRVARGSEGGPGSLIVELG